MFAIIIVFDVLLEDIGLIIVSQDCFLAKQPSNTLAARIIFSITGSTNIVPSDARQLMGVEPHDMIYEFNR